MLRVRATCLALAVLVGLGAACSDGATGPRDDALRADEVEFLALQTDEMLDAMLGQQIGSMQGAVSQTEGIQLSLGGSEPIFTTVQFTLTRTCPAGGLVKVEGAVERMADRETGVVETSLEGEKTRVDCVYRRGEVTITVDGEARFEAFRRKVNGEFDGLQTTDVVGEFSYVTSDGRGGSCEFELHSTFDPETDTRTVTGHYCGREIDRTMQRGS